MLSTAHPAAVEPLRYASPEQAAGNGADARSDRVIAGLVKVHSAHTIVDDRVIDDRGVITFFRQDRMVVVVEVIAHHPVLGSAR